ncbi:MAG: hypothetical protein U5J97_07685 [Trueperaceae bacterium]|nr:hypothetical protein [Trueperaceae bacterium]
MSWCSRAASRGIDLVEDRGVDVDLEPLAGAGGHLVAGLLRQGELLLADVVQNHRLQDGQDDVEALAQLVVLDAAEHVEHDAGVAGGHDHERLAEPGRDETEQGEGHAQATDGGPLGLEALDGQRGAGDDQGDGDEEECTHGVSLHARQLRS